jgi:hypothetical protein
MVNIDLSGLDSLTNEDKPSNLDMIYYLFWDKGISKTDFDELPLPYIMSILKTHSYIKEQEAKEMKKAQRKR